MLAPEMAVYTEEDGMESAGPLTPVDGPVEYVRATALAEAQAHIARLHDQVGDWIVRADEAHARADRLEVALRDIARLYPRSGAANVARAALAQGK